MNKILLKLSVFLVCNIFLLGGIATFMGAPRFVNEFTHWGYPLSWLKYVGMFEIVCAFLLIPRATRLFSAGLLFLVAALGLVKHITTGDPVSLMIPGIVLVVLIGAIFGLRKAV